MQQKSLRVSAQFNLVGVFSLLLHILRIFYSNQGVQNRQVLKLPYSLVEGSILC